MRLLQNLAGLGGLGLIALGGLLALGWLKERDLRKTPPAAMAETSDAEPTEREEHP